ncbi:MAG: orotate phosphoribosyltransferase, partial [Gammaproteobacteria bacterium]
RESISLLEHHGAVPAGVLIALDRQERGQGKKSAVQEVEDTLGLAVVSIATLDDLIGHLDTSRRADDLAAVQRYRVEYGV